MASGNPSDDPGGGRVQGEFGSNDQQTPKYSLGAPVHKEKGPFVTEKMSEYQHEQGVSKGKKIETPSDTHLNNPMKQDSNPDSKQNRCPSTKQPKKEAGHQTSSGTKLRQPVQKDREGPKERTEKKEKATEGHSDKTTKMDKETDLTEKGKNPTPEMEDRKKHTESPKEMAPETEKKEKATEGHSNKTTKTNKETDRTERAETSSVDEKKNADTEVHSSKQEQYDFDQNDPSGKFDGRQKGVTGGEDVNLNGKKDPQVDVDNLTDQMKKLALGQGTPFLLPENQTVEDCSDRKLPSNKHTNDSIGLILSIVDGQTDVNTSVADGTEDGNEKPQSHGVAEQQDSHGDEVKPDSHGDTEQPYREDGAKDPHSTGIAEQPDSQSVAEQPGSHGVATQLNILDEGADQPTKSEPVREKAESHGVAKQPDSRCVAGIPESCGVTKQPDSHSITQQPESLGVVEQPGSLGVAEQPDSHGFTKQPLSVDVAKQPQSHSFAEQSGSHGFEVQPDSHGVAEQPHSLGITEQPVSHGFAEQPGSYGVTEKSHSHGFAEKPSSDGFAEQPSSDGFAEQPGSLSVAEQPHSNGVIKQYKSDSHGVTEQPKNHGLVEEAGKKSCCITVLFRNKTLRMLFFKNVYLKRDAYMKCMFALKEESTFKRISEKYLEENKAELKKGPKQLIVCDPDETQRDKYEGMAPIEFVTDELKNLSTFKISVKDHRMFTESDYLSQELKNSEYFADYDEEERTLYFCCSKSLEKRVRSLIQESDGKFSAEVKHQSVVIKGRYVFAHLVESEEFISEIKQMFPDFRKTTITFIENRTDVCISFVGPSCQIKDFQKEFEKLMNKYSTLDISFREEVKGTDPKTDVGVLKEFIPLFLKNEDIIKYVIDEVACRIWLYSETSQSKLDSVKPRLKACIAQGVRKEEVHSKKQVSEELLQRFNHVRLQEENGHFYLIGLSTEVITFKHEIESQKKVLGGEDRTAFTDGHTPPAKQTQLKLRETNRNTDCLDKFSRKRTFHSAYGQEVICVVSTASECKGEAKIHLIPETGVRLKTHEEQFVYIIGVPSGRWDKSKHQGCDKMKSALHDIILANIFSIHITLCANFKEQSKALKAILHEVFQWILRLRLPISVVLECPDDSTYSVLNELCNGSLKGWKATTFHQTPRKPNRLQVNVEEGEIAKYMADVLVNTASRDFDLRKGAVSKSILLQAGSGIQDELNTKTKDGGAIGDVIVTRAGQIKACKHVFHGALEVYKDCRDLLKLKDFVVKCIQRADSLNCTSIALPAIGAGNLKFPVADVAKTMFESVLSAEPLNFVKYISFLVYKSDTCSKEFKKQKSIFDKCADTSCSYGHLRYWLQTGSLRNTPVDSVIYLWHKKLLQQGDLDSDKLLTAAGSTVKGMFSKHRSSSKDQILSTHGGQLPTRNIYHVPCDDTEASFGEVLSQSITKAHREGQKTICIAYEPDTFGKMKRRNAALVFLNHVVSIGHDLTGPMNIIFLVDNEKEFPAVDELFREAKMQDQSTFEQTTTGRAGVRSQTTDKGSTGLKTALVEERMGRSETGFEDIHTEPSLAASMLRIYVKVKNVPKDSTYESLKYQLDLKQFGLQTQPTLVYCDKRDSALLLCRSTSDAEKLHDQQLGPMVLRQSDFMSIKNVRKKMGREKVKKILDIPGIMAKISDAGITFSKCFEFMEAPSLIQMEYAVTLIKSATSESGCIEDFESIEHINNITDNIWYVIQQSAQYVTIKDVCQIEYYEGSVHFSGNVSDMEEEIKNFKVYVNAVKEMESEEIFVTQFDSEKIKNVCSEINNALRSEFSSDIIKDKCYYFADKQTVVFLCEKYDQLLKARHMFMFKTGQVKGTGRNRRTVADVSVSTKGDGAQKENLNKGSSQKIVSKETNAEHSRWQHTTENGITIYVYETDIVTLKVDCIVNAANTKLEHGGGVALAIARAAGPAMEKDDKNFLKTSGKLEVGKACTVSAGKLPCRYVIHTVGPDWRYYYPHDEESKQRVKQDLFSAVFNSFLEAEHNNLETLAIPAISSAIFGVPEEICVQQYARALEEYIQKAESAPGHLREIHFVDKNAKMVVAIQKEFQRQFDDKNTSTCKSRAGGSTSLRSDQASLYVNEHGASYSPMNCQGSSKEIVREVLHLFDKDLNEYVYMFGEGQMLVLDRRDIKFIKADAVAVKVNSRGEFGHFVKKIFPTLTPSVIRPQLQDKKVGEVIPINGYQTPYRDILLCLFDASSEFKNIDDRTRTLEHTFAGIFDKCKKQNISSVCIPLIAVDTSNAHEVEKCSQVFLECYLRHCKMESEISTPLTVHVVSKNDTCRAIMTSLLDKHIKKENDKLEQSQKITAAAGQSSDLSKESEETCAICLDKMESPKTIDCGHSFCSQCIDDCLAHKAVCPICGKILGKVMGDQPEGTMTVKYSSQDCSGFPGMGQIVITYRFLDGKQKDFHPSPGSSYKGITRVAYLPNNRKGRQVLKMLQLAFERKLVFTIGRSRTTGHEGVITWNDIHHKTDPRPNTQFGYPDSGYLDRVIDELSAKGITPEDVIES